MGDYVRWAPPYYGERRAAGPRHPLGALPGAQPRQALDPHRPEVRRRARRRSCSWPRMPTSCSRASGPACSTASASATSACASATRGSSTARSPATARRAEHAPAPATTRTTSRSTGCSASPAQPAARRSRRPARSPTSAAAALMAAFGILAALHERERSGEGQFVDVSMTDGALSWLAMVAGAYLCDGERPAARRRRAQRRRRLLPALRVRRRLGQLRRARAEVLAGVLRRRRARGPDRAPVRAAGLRGPRARSPRSSARSTQGRVGGLQRRARLLHRAGARPRRGARLRAGPRARDGGRARAAARSARCACSGMPVKFSRTPGDPTRPAPALGEHTSEVLREAGLGGEEIARCSTSGAAAGPSKDADQEPFHVVSAVEPRAGAAEDLRARRAGGGAGRDRAPLPARGPAARAGEDLEEHGLLPARVRRADPADQAAPGGALHAAAGDPRGPRLGGGRPRARCRRSSRSATRSSTRVLAPQSERTPEAEILRALRHPGAGAPPPRGGRRAEPGRGRLLARPRSASSRRSPAFVRPAGTRRPGFGARDVARLMSGLTPVITDELELLMERFAGARPRSRRRACSTTARARSRT